ncbi:MAG: zf-HC2 domain-containing protein [Candidatus Euphemobacter frigidus]|nr:zf-HC2 domain-containing protein [Candidatus Euphemobacter frigidus]MDP8276714.1 zf-HC2 domain-containing protein [Candidatus Euphemobacter frigidus]
MKCDRIREYLLDRVLGEPLPDSVEDEIRKHLARCSQCRRCYEETRAAWQSLEALERLSFPLRLSRNVLREAASRPRPGGLRLSDLLLNFRHLSPLAAAAALIAGVGLFLFLRESSGPDRTEGPAAARSASAFSRQLLPLPDPTKTLKDYLKETRNILGGIREGTYNTWGSVLSEIVSRDLQGRANYLLENSDLPPASRLIVRDLHDKFWLILRSGRGREEEALSLPPEVDPVALLDEIDKFNLN